MPLEIGGRLGDYEILSLLGSGGMGEVYRAHDPKLGRDVAIKVLPEAFSQEPERLGRFEREARLLASLNHPNIATLFDFLESEGTHYLSMELVEGETLEERVRGGPLEVSEALPLFLQIAEALEAAHDQGIVHRDLKPANVKVTPEGRVKVLDFGLAKGLGPPSPDPDSTQSQSASPTRTLGQTVEGVVLGTAPYMSPEQARGQPLDQRTDLWAFGCVLFEALTGERTFGGETVTDTLASIVKEEPDWSRLPETTPLRIRDLLSRCLRKEPGKRLREAGSARLDIQDTLAGLSGVTPALSAGVQSTARRRRLLPLLGALVLGGLAVGLFDRIALPSETTAPAAVKRLMVRLPPTDELALIQADRSVAISPHGSHLVYRGYRDGRLGFFVRPMGSPEASRIAWGLGTTFSPDGLWMGFTSPEGKLEKVPLTGGPPVTVTELDFTVRGLSWGPDDTIYFVGESSGQIALWSVAAQGGAPRQIGTLRWEVGSTESPGPSDFSTSSGYDSWAAFSWPDILPDGKTILYTHRLLGSDRTPSIVAVSTETAAVRPLVEGGTDARYVPSGHLVFARDEALVAVPFDVDRLETLGPPVPVLERVRVGASGFADYALSEEGTLLYVTQEQFRPGVLVTVARDGTSRVRSEARRFYHPRLSPDGNRVLVSVRGEAEGAHSWVYDLTRDTLTRLTFEGRGEDSPAIWSPDGREIVFGSRREDDSAMRIYRMAADGSGPAQPLRPRGGRYWAPTSWSPDGELLTFIELGLRSDIGISTLSLDGESEPQPLLDSRFNDSQARFSPDGRWIAYLSDESGRWEVYVRPYPGPGEKTQISNEGGSQPVWARDGKELFYRNGDRMMVVPVETGSTFVASPPRVLFEGEYEADGLGFWTNYDVMPDGQSFVMIRGTEERPREIHVVLNWFEELERLAPNP